MTRDFDIVLFGATGFTGQKTAEYLARHAPSGLRWAIAARNLAALDALKQRLVAIDARCATLTTLAVSSEDDAAVERMVARTQVVLTTAGPFIDHGEPVVRACVAHGTDYVDSTGEPAFVRLLFERYAQQAAARGVRIVPCCAYGCIPADLGAFFTVRELPPDQPIHLSAYLASDAEFSGGHDRSAIKVLAGEVPSARGVEVPALRPGARVRIDTAKAERKAEFGGWVVPLPTLDAQFVTRSAAALDRYGPDFSYAHHAVIGSFWRVIAGLLLMGRMALFARIPPLRDMMLRRTAKSGTGPSEERMQRSWFKLSFVARSGARVVRTEVSGGDPGYGETSKMLAESALCLALDRESLPAVSGVLTPAVAMGDLLLARLQRAGLRFRVL
jgi:short subunit dehydrogenase-like uncharacterized protein